ncbi:hypothetical protein SCACP_07610 [Sporomusa carbonis]
MRQHSTYLRPYVSTKLFTAGTCRFIHGTSLLNVVVLLTKTKKDCYSQSFYHHQPVDHNSQTSNCNLLFDFRKLLSPIQRSPDRHCCSLVLPGIDSESCLLPGEKTGKNNWRLDNRPRLRPGLPSVPGFSVITLPCQF